MDIDLLGDEVPSPAAFPQGCSDALPPLPEPEQTNSGGGVTVVDTGVLPRSEEQPCAPAALPGDAGHDGILWAEEEGSSRDALPDEEPRSPARYDDPDVDTAEETGINSGSGGEDEVEEASSGGEQAVQSDDPEEQRLAQEEDAFGDFTDFTSAATFMPGASLASSLGPGTLASPLGHRHGHAGHPSSGFATARSTHGGLSAGGTGHGGTSSIAPSSAVPTEAGSFAGDLSDYGHPSPPPSVAPSHRGAGRKSVASIASVGSRAGGDDDIGDYNSVVGSSVWRAPSQMATSSYAAAAGADDDFGDFTSDITSTSDFTPSTQPPSAVAVSGPGSVHPDDDFGSFASHRSTADDDEDDFGNFAAAPAAQAAPGAAGSSSSGAGPSGSGSHGPSGAGGSGSAAGPSGSGLNHSGGSGGWGAAAAAAVAGASSSGESGPGPSAGPYHSTQSVGPGSAAGDAAGGSEHTLLHLPPAELRAAVAQALQPLLPAHGSAVLRGAAGAGAEGLQPPAAELVAAAWGQLRRHAAGAAPDSVLALGGIPLPPLQPAAGQGPAEAGAVGAGGYTPVARYPRPLRWKGTESERRLLAGLGLSEVAAAAARAQEAAEARQQQPSGGGAGPGGVLGGAGSVSRGRNGSGLAGPGSGRQHSGSSLGLLATFGDGPKRPRQGQAPGHEAAGSAASQHHESDGGSRHASHGGSGGTPGSGTPRPVGRLHAGAAGAAGASAASGGSLLDLDTAGSAGGSVAGLDGPNGV